MADKPVWTPIEETRRSFSDLTAQEKIEEWDRQVVEWRKVHIETKYSFVSTAPISVVTSCF